MVTNMDQKRDEPAEYCDDSYMEIECRGPRHVSFAANAEPPLKTYIGGRANDAYEPAPSVANTIRVYPIEVND